MTLLKKLILPFLGTAERKSVQKLWKKIKKISQRGDNVVCSICGSKFRVFATHGVAMRKNAKCLHCDSLERHRLVWRFIRERTDFQRRQDLRLLHFAPERSFYSLFSKNERIDYFPCDLQPERYPYEDGAKIYQADITAIPFPENHFDVVLCSHVLEHIPNDRLAMAELYRVMKPNGWGIFQVPIDYRRDTTYEDFSITTQSGRLKAFGQEDHVRWYGKDYKDRLANSGFTVREDNFITSFSDADLFRYGLLKGELIYYCEKPDKSAERR